VDADPLAFLVSARDGHGMYYYIGSVTTSSDDHHRSHSSSSSSSLTSRLRIPSSLLAKAEQLVLVVVSEDGVLTTETVPVRPENQRTATACLSRPDADSFRPAARKSRRMEGNEEEKDDDDISPPVLVLSVLSGLAATLLVVLAICAYKLWLQSRGETPETRRGRPILQAQAWRGVDDKNCPPDVAHDGKMMPGYENRRDLTNFRVEDRNGQVVPGEERTLPDLEDQAEVFEGERRVSGYEVYEVYNTDYEDVYVSSSVLV
jgi:hypothetical protein